MIVGQNIKHYRFKMNMTQETLSEKTKLSANAISSIENGKSDVKLSHLYKISQELNIDIKDLFNMNDVDNLKWRVDLKSKKN